MIPKKPQNGNTNVANYAEVTHCCTGWTVG